MTRDRLSLLDRDYPCLTSRTLLHWVTKFKVIPQLVGPLCVLSHLYVCLLRGSWSEVSVGLVVLPVFQGLSRYTDRLRKSDVLVTLH